MGIHKLTANQVAELADKFLRGIATEEEAKLLHDWYNSVNPAETESVVVPFPTTSEDIRSEILMRVRERIDQEKATELPVTHSRRKWYYAAAAILVILYGATYYNSFNKIEQTKSPSLDAALVKEVIAPRSARAVITLSNGKKIFVDSAADGVIAIQAHAHVIKNGDGQITYVARNTSADPEYNLLVVPRGSRVVSLRLTDGTRVWLNSESSMRYPVAFIGNTRKVQITGEAYFEVTRDPTRSFYVESRGTTTEVLGTHFNVNTYEDESAINVTLLEGSVHVSNVNGGSAMLKPGEQASITNVPAIRVLSNIDTQAVIAWKNEHFMMKGTDLGALARQMARWYDIEIVFPGAIPDKKFGGSISRNVNLATMLKALEESGVQSKLIGRTVTIK